MISIHALLKEEKIRKDERTKILNALQKQLDHNTTRTMTFTEEGLALAIKIVEELK
jgi:hypothetical protein